MIPMRDMPGPLVPPPPNELGPTYTCQGVHGTTLRGLRDILRFGRILGIYWMNHNKARQLGKPRAVYGQIWWKHHGTWNENEAEKKKGLSLLERGTKLKIGLALLFEGVVLDRLTAKGGTEGENEKLDDHHVISHKGSKKKTVTASMISERAIGITGVVVFPDLLPSVESVLDDVCDGDLVWPGFTW